MSESKETIVTDITEERVVDEKAKQFFAELLHRTSVYTLAYRMSYEEYCAAPYWEDVPASVPEKYRKPLSSLLYYRYTSGVLSAIQCMYQEDKDNVLAFLKERPGIPGHTTEAISATMLRAHLAEELGRLRKFVPQGFGKVRATKTGIAIFENVVLPRIVKVLTAPEFVGRNLLELEEFSVIPPRTLLQLWKKIYNTTRTPRGGSSPEPQAQVQEESQQVQGDLFTPTDSKPGQLRQLEALLAKTLKAGSRAFSTGDLDKVRLLLVRSQLIQEKLQALLKVHEDIEGFLKVHGQ